MDKHREIDKEFFVGFVAEKFDELAEEAAELSQAALKLIRAKGLSGNPTPISDEEAEAHLAEDYKKLTGREL